MLQMMETFADLFEAYGAFTVVSLAVLMPLGWIEWIWMGLRLGSFSMVFIGIVLPLPFAIPTGLYALAFGAPDWVIFVFG